MQLRAETGRTSTTTAGSHTPTSMRLDTTLQCPLFRRANGPWLSCRAASATEPAVRRAAGGQVAMVAPTVARSKLRSARPCQLQPVVGRLFTRSTRNAILGQYTYEMLYGVQTEAVPGVTTR